MTKRLTVDVKLRGAAEAILASEQIEVEVETLTPREIILAIARMNPALQRQIVRDDGNPRQSSKILIDGTQPDDLDSEFPSGASVMFSPMLPCDG